VTTPEVPALNGRHVETFIDGKGARLLEVIQEQALPDAAWACYSHGAFVPVRGPHAALFDRLVVVLVRPEDQAADVFRPWAEQRLAQLDRYMEASNTGKVVRTVPRDRCVVGVVMRRVGRDPLDAAGELPPLEEVPRILARFAREVDRYVRMMGDDGLRYVRALRLHVVPRKKGPPEYALGLDALQTVLGLRDPPLPLSPTALVRGIAAELAQVVRGRGDELRMARTPLHPVEALRRAHARHRHEGLADALLAVAARIGETNAEPSTAAKWLDAVRVPRFTRPLRLVAALVALLAAVGAATWFLRGAGGG
jgi:hypothetical protein